MERVRDLASKLFVSYEPALEAVDFEPYLETVFPIDGYPDDPRGTPGCVAVNWLIVGGESGSGARHCDIEWVRSARAQCLAAGVPFFCKQFGSSPLAAHPRDLVHLRHKKGGEMAEWPEDLRVREFPEARR